MEYRDIIYLVVIIAGVLLAILVIMFFLMRIIEKNRNEDNYNHQQNHALIESQRNFYEKQLYELVSRLTIDNKRWFDLNQMLVSAQGNTNITAKQDKTKILINSFLRNCGVTDDDLVIDEKLVFTLIPLSDSFSGLYKDIKKVCDKNELNAVKSDEEFISGAILNHIIKLIVKSRFIIAVLDGRNANVYYELGIAHALGKEIILVSAAKDYLDMPFDIKSVDIVFYQTKHSLAIQLHDRIKKLLVRT